MVWWESYPHHFDLPMTGTYDAAITIENPARCPPRQRGTVLALEAAVETRRTIDIVAPIGVLAGNGLRRSSAASVVSGGGALAWGGSTGAAASSVTGAGEGGAASGGTPSDDDGSSSPGEAQERASSRGRATVLSLILISWLLPSCSIGGGRDSGARSTDAATGTTDASSIPSVEADAPDASGGDARDEGDLDASNVSPWPLALAATGTVVCQVIWPQPAGVALAALNPAQLSADGAGNMFLALNFEGSLSDAGVGSGLVVGQEASPGATGFVVAKIDSACRVLWTRWFTADAPQPSYGGPMVGLFSAGLAADIEGGLSVVAEYAGISDPIDGGVASATPDAASANAIFDGMSLIRLDPDSGATLVQRVVKGIAFLSISNVSVSADGTTGLIPTTGGSRAVDWDGGGLETPYEPDSDVPEVYLVQYDRDGGLVGALAVQNDSMVGRVVMDADGGFWATTTNGTRMTLSPEEAFAWSFPSVFDCIVSDGQLISVSGEYGDLNVVPSETLQGIAFDGGVAWTQTTLTPYLGSADTQQIATGPSGGPLFVGGNFYGTGVSQPDGAILEVPSPVSIGYQEFDSTGHLMAVGNWAGTAQPHFGALGLSSTGSVWMSGASPWGVSPNVVYLVQMQP